MTSSTAGMTQAVADHTAKVTVAPDTLPVSRKVDAA